MKLAAGPWMLVPLLLALGCDGPAGDGSPALSFTFPTEVFPDTVIDRDGGTRAIAMTNVSDEAVTPTFALSSDTDFSIIGDDCDSLAAGASCSLVVQFRPHTLGARTVEVVATAGGTTVSGMLVGLALPEAGLMSIATTSNFGDVALDTSKTLRFAIRNGSFVEARPFTVALTGADTSDFTINADACSGRSPPSMARCNVDVTFTPSATTVRSAQLVVSSGNLGDLSIPLDGNGFIPAQIVVSPANGTFGSVFESSASLAQSFTVTNPGTVATPELHVAITGEHANYFSITDGCSGFPLAGGASCVFSVVYHAATVGMHQAAATVSAESLDAIVVPLAGTGEPSQLSVTPPAWNFGQVLVGEPTEKIFTVTNTGSSTTGVLTAVLASSLTMTVTSDGCTGSDLAPGVTCSVAVQGIATSRLTTFAALQILAARGDRTFAGIQLQGIEPATLTATPSVTVFGDVQLTETARQAYAIRNTGDLATGVLTVAVVGADRADFTLTENCSGQPLASSGGCSLALVFSPSRVGPASAAIVIGSPTATVTIPVTANGLPAPLFGVSPGTVVRNPVLVGQSYPLTFVVQGSGGTTGPLTVEVSGPNADEYATTADTCSGVSLASTQACTVTLSLTPTRSGSRDAVLRVSGQPGGYRTVSMTSIAFVPATLLTSRPTIVFSPTGVGSTDSYGFLIIKNVGQLPTGTLTTQLTGANPAQFEIIADTCTGVVLAPAGECSVHTEFAPTVAAASTANLAVTASPGGTAVSSLSGTGLPPPVIVATASSYQFPPQETFTSRSISVRIDNIGGSPTDRLHARVSGARASEFRPNDYQCYAVSAGGGCNVTVDFNPTEVGPASVTLIVESQLAASVEVVLTATATPGTSISVFPATFDFGLVAAGSTSAIASFTGTNIGQRDVTMFHAFLSSFCDNFSIVATTCGPSLAPGASCQVDVVFHPLAWTNDSCRLVFVENTLVRGESELRGQSPF